MLFKRKPKQKKFNLIDIVRYLNEEFSVTLTQHYEDKEGKKTEKLETKNAFVWLPTLLIEINQTLQKIEQKLK